MDMLMNTVKSETSAFKDAENNREAEQNMSRLRLVLGAFLVCAHEFANNPNAAHYSQLQTAMLAYQRSIYY